MHRDIVLKLHLDEDDTITVATATLDLRDDHFVATGKARRNPADEPAPLIGEELAVSRALGSLTAMIMEAAQDKVAAAAAG